MRRLLLATALAALCAPVALADTGVTVPLPDLSGLSDDEAATLLEDLVFANVASSNCDDYAISDGEWTLITGSADKLADQLGLSVDQYDEDFYSLAFASADYADFCELEGPGVASVLARLTAMGGSAEPVTEESGIAEDTDEPAPPPARGADKNTSKN